LGCGRPVGSGLQSGSGQLKGGSERSHTLQSTSASIWPQGLRNRREAAVASTPCSPSTENTRGVKVRHWAMNRAPYFSFFSFSYCWRTFSGAVLRCNRASVSVTRTSKIAVMPLVQKPWTATSPRSSGAGSVRVDPATCTSRLVWISGLLETVEGVWAWPHSCPHMATRSLWRWRIRPPLQQDMVCSVVKCLPHLSHWGGREMGGNPKQRRRPSRNSTAERSEPLRKLGRVESHAPVAADQRMRCLSIGQAALRIVASLPSVACRWCALASR
jgi:hypothetical protein